MADAGGSKPGSANMEFKEMKRKPPHHLLWNMNTSRLVQAWILSCTECWWESWLVFSPWSSSGGGLAGKGLEELFWCVESAIRERPLSSVSLLLEKLSRLLLP